MKTRKTLHFARSAVALAALSALTACSSAANDAGTPASGGEHVASSSAPLLNQEQAQLTSSMFGLVLEVANVSGSTIGYVASPSSVVFTPSTALAQMAKGATGQPLAPLSIPLPPLSFDPGGSIGTLCAPFTVTFTGFGLTNGSPAGAATEDLSGVTLAMGANGISISGLQFNASAQVASGNPLACQSFDLAVNNGTVSGTVGWDASLQEFNVTSVSATLPATVSHCLFGACDSLVQGALPNLAALLEGVVTTGLNGVFSQQQAPIQGGLGAVLVQVWNTLHPVTSGSPWALGNVWGAANDIGFDPSTPDFWAYVTQTATAPAPHCAFSAATCGDQIGATCTADSTAGSDPIEIFQAINGQWTEIGQLPVPSGTTMTTANFTTLYNGGATSGQFLGCAMDAAGESCDLAPTTITFNGACSTSGGRSGGGGGGGYTGPSGCVGRCPQ